MGAQRKEIPLSSSFSSPYLYASACPSLYLSLPVTTCFSASPRFSLVLSVLLLAIKTSWEHCNWQAAWFFEPTPLTHTALFWCTPTLNQSQRLKTYNPILVLQTASIPHLFALPSSQIDSQNQQNLCLVQELCYIGTVINPLHPVVLIQKVAFQASQTWPAFPLIPPTCFSK